jgi:glutamine---fructose-6-phosphate transaminase (isomerizing)
MCGILGYVGDNQASAILVNGLKKLEYRGYDSAGVAVLSQEHVLLRRAVGKLCELETLLKKHPVQGTTGLGHTRWATHGAPTEVNAHPHTDAAQKIVVVHNGIIENYLTLKKKLKARRFHFKSDTDTEVVAHLVAYHWGQLEKTKKLPLQQLFVESVRCALAEVEGTFALGVLSSAVPDVVIGARRDCPLIIGLGKNQNFLASDVPAVLPYTRQVIFLEENDLAIIMRDKVSVIDTRGKPVKRPVTTIKWNPAQAEKAGYKHFMLKEIHEQPRVIEDSLLGRLLVPSGSVRLVGAHLSVSIVKSIAKIRFIACGTSWHAGLIGSYLIEKYTGIPCQADIASEFRYRDPVLEKNTLVVAVSQSGETADTLAAIRLAKKKGAHVLAITNVVGSTLTRDAHGTILTQCGPEIGVASTKAFVGQLVAMHLLALYMADIRRSLPPKRLKELAGHLAHLSQWVTKTLECEPHVKAVAARLYKRRDFLFIGRNVNYPVALEGALKLKEISYIHAEGYPAGELKHGPIALIDAKMPVVALATPSAVYEKMASNIQEARSRGAETVVIAVKGDSQLKKSAEHMIRVPDVPEDISPMINVIPLQLLAYYIAVQRGCDVDQPRNLAKSVTVE